MMYMYYYNKIRENEEYTSMINDTIGIQKRVNMMYSNDLSKWRAERDFALLETVALHIVHKNRFKSCINIFFINTVCFIANSLFLSVLLLMFDALPYFVFKIGTLITLVISTSYFSSLQVRRLYRARQLSDLTAIQLMQAAHERGVGWENEDQNDDRKYLSLLKQDTAAYLSALKIKGLRKGVQ